MRLVHAGAQLGGLADRRCLFGILGDGDLDRSLAARFVAGVQHGFPHRLTISFIGAVFIAAARSLYHRFHHCARENRLRLQRPNGQQQEQQRSQ